LDAGGVGSLLTFGHVFVSVLGFHCMMCFSFILLQSYLAVCCANEWHPKETTSDVLTALLFADAMYFQPELLPTTNRLDVQIKGGWSWEAFTLFDSDSYKPYTFCILK